MAKPLDKTNGYLRKAGAAEYLNISERCLTNLMQRRVVPFHRLSRGLCLFRVADLDAALERYRVKSVGELRGQEIQA